MANILFANNASTLLAAPISSSATICTLTTGTGTEFPNPTGGQYFVMTFIDAATGLLNEIIHVTARSGDTCTIQRAQEGTTALSWLAGDTAANLLTAGSIAAIQAGFPIGTETITSNTTFSIADTGNLIRINAASVVATLPAASTVSGMAIGFSAGNASTVAITPSGGAFEGGALTGQTSASLAFSDFLCVQSNGTNWIIFAGSPDIIVGGVIALESWVTANFDALGAAATAQSNAEAFATAHFLPLTGGTITSNLTVDNNLTVGDVLTISPAGSAATLLLSGPTGQAAQIELASDADTIDWKIFDSAAGNLSIARFVGGAFVDNPISITQSTGVAGFSQIPTFSTAAPGDSSDNGANTAFVTAALQFYNIGKGVTVTAVTGNGSFHRLIRLTVTAPPGGTTVQVMAWVSQFYTAGTPNWSVKITVDGTDFSPVSNPTGGGPMSFIETQANVALTAGSHNIDLNWNGASSGIQSGGSTLTVFGAA